jgi:hypothetical protein
MFSKAYILAAVASVSAIAVAGTASAAPTAFNGHFYEFVAFSGGSGNWDQAFSLANGSSFNGLQGYLATVTSAEENSFLSSLSTNVAYLGGTSAGTPGTWRWANGPETGDVFFTNGVTPPGSFTSWAENKPDNFGGGEFWLQTNFGEVGKWNDTWIGGQSGDVVTSGYFVEYSASGAVPEPASWAMLSLGFLGLGFAVRRNKQPRVTFG